MATEQPKNKGGRPEGSANRWSREARELARADSDGRLPHEILLQIARGRPVEIAIIDPESGKQDVDEKTGELRYKIIYPSMDDIRSAAQAAAPYFAPKIATVELNLGATEDELYAIAQELAAQAGITLGFGRDGEATESTVGPGSNPEGPATAEPRVRRSVD